MKQTVSLLLLCLLWVLPTNNLLAQPKRIERGNLAIEGIPDIPEQLSQRLNQYQNARAAYLQAWLPSSNGILISTRFGETSQFHRLAAPGAARQQLTFFEEPVGGARMNPNPDRNGFLFRKDLNGSEFYQLFFFDLDTGTSQLLTDGKSRNGGALWSNQGDRFAFFSTRRNGRDWDLYLADLQHPQRAEPILTEGGAWTAVDWSPDDRQLLVGKYVSASESYVYQLNLETQQLTPFQPTSEKVAYTGAAYSKDGQGIYFISDRNSEFQRLQYADLATGEIRALTEQIPWDVEDFVLSDDGRYLAFTVNAEGMSQLQLLDLRSMASVPVPELPVGLVYGLKFSPDSSQLGLVLNTPQTTGDVYSLDLTRRKLERWTYSEVGGLNTANFTIPDLIRYETFDRVNGQPRTIPAFYYKPRGNGPFPVLISIHGGPESQSRPFFNPTLQYYVNELGIAVLKPNVRGSAGYGKGYLQLDNGFKREDAVKDIGALLDWIEQQPDLDRDRIAVSGGSYGGYMVLASMIHYNDRLRAGIDVVGISNFVTFLENTQDYRRELRRAEYGDERDAKMRQFLLEISPTTHADKITKPLFAIQGLNDPRVPVSESEQIVRIVRENGGTVWYLLAKDEGHGFRKKNNRDYARQATVLFLERFLLDR